MKIQLVSLPQPYSSESLFLSPSFYGARLQLVADIINKSGASLILFSGWAACLSEIPALSNLLDNRDVVVVLDVADNFSKIDLKEAEKSKFKHQKDEGQILLDKKLGINALTDKLNNFLYLYKNGQLIDLHTQQVFATSSKATSTNIEELIKELQRKRQFKLQDKNCLVFQCGEINILRNEQANGNAVHFRLKNTPELEDQFNTILKDCDIILNPIHYPMGNQGKMKQRRIFLTQNGRAYFSSANIAHGASALGSSHQYAFRAGNPMHYSYTTTKSFMYQSTTYNAFITTYNL